MTMTADSANDLLAGRPEPKRDRWGRYVIPHPQTGTEQSWIRATTWASSVAETFGISKWEQRLVAVGLARRPDLLAQVASVVDPDDPDAKTLLNKLVVEAHEFAGSAVGRNNGTALHSFGEHVDHGRQVQIPEPYDADIAAYQAEMARQQITIDPVLIERIVVCCQLGVAGTLDRILGHTSWSKPRVGDLKTGKDLSYAAGEIAIQLAIYANAETIWDQQDQVHLAMPEVDRDVAVVMWLPVGKAHCELLEVNIADGWEMAATCGIVRAYRARKDLLQPLTSFVPPATALAPAQTVTEPPSVTPPVAAPAPSGAGTPPAAAPLPPADQVVPPTAPAPQLAPATPPCSPERRAWIVQRISDILTVNADAGAALAQAWPAGIPTFRSSDTHTDADVDQVAAACSAVEQRFQLEFPHETDPNHPDMEPKVAGDDQRIVELADRILALPTDLQAGIVAAAAVDNMPRLTSGKCTVSQVAAVEDLVGAAEIDHTDRIASTNEVLHLLPSPDPETISQLIRLVAGEIPPRKITETQLEHLAVAVDAVACGYLTVTDGTVAVNPEAEQLVITVLGDKRTALSLGKKAAKARGLDSPRAFADLLADPLLLALTVLGDPDQATDAAA